MNENLLERFGRSKPAYSQQRQQAYVWLLPQQLNMKVRQYFDEAKSPSESGTWAQRPEIPASEEILPQDTDDSSSDSRGLQPNRRRGSWESKEHYLRAQYELLREDAVRPLREAVARVKFVPEGNEASFEGTGIGIYDKVHICGVTCSTRGIAIRVTLSLHRIGKQILWEQSKRLITGSIVVLTPTSDMFATKAIVATVAARPLAGLQQNPSEVDLFFARPEDLELDPAQEWVMVEDRGGMYEAQRHTLLALQRMMIEPFPLSEHVVFAQPDISPPEYLKNDPTTDMTAVLTNNKDESYEKVDILNRWPPEPQSELDSSQLEALRRILTKKLAIVQGPPGTGKTHVSVQAVRVLLANRKDDDPPIIIACQTNHAVDQFLRHIAKFEGEFARLGGRSKDREVIKQRTLYELKRQTSENPLPGSAGTRARKRMRDLEKEIVILITALKPGDYPLDVKLLRNFGLLSQHQADTLETGASQWVQDQLSNPNQARSPFMVWLGKNLITVPPKQLPENFGFEYEEADIEFEQLKELEAENAAKEDEEHEGLSGNWYPIADNFTCRKTPGTTEPKVKAALKEQDMWKIPEAMRPAVYRYLQSEAKSMIVAEVRIKAKAFNEEAHQRRIGRWEDDEVILKKQKIIGMTTTGLSKYRGLLAAMEPKIILIEEAAETLEAPVTVACLPSVEHLILVGDHQQLRPHCHVKALENKPFYFNVSLFERLVGNNIEFSTLCKQRRMIPEIRRLLYPIYKDIIEDHPSVLNAYNRPDVPGMGGVNSYFFTHEWPEQRDDQMSAFNPNEADMIVGLVEYLVYNRVETDRITVLTFYNGQRKKILKQLRDRVSLRSADGPMKFNVVTVDSYQGEENDVVILSLVRSNDKGQIGFLDVANRVCVALSRAKCGFYIFGNGQLLYKNKIWKGVLKIMANSGAEIDQLKSEPSCRLGDALPLRCSNHNNQTDISDASDFDKISGGCSKIKCNEKLLCNHPCDLMCHPFSHQLVICHQPCESILGCGHPCKEECGETCYCKVCSKISASIQSPGFGAKNFDGKEAPSRASSADSWQSFAESEPELYAAIASAPVARRMSPLKQCEGNALLDLTSTNQMEQKMDKMRFGGDGTTSLPPSFSSPELIEEKVSKDGTRMMRREKFAIVKVKESDSDKEDWSKKASLLD